MNFDTILNYIIVAFCSSFSIYLKTEFSLTGLNALYIPPAGAIALYISLHALLKLPLLIKPWRLLVRPEAKIEGDWIEHVTKNGIQYYSLFNMSYIWKKNQYVVSGVALTENGAIHAHWNSTNIEYNESLLELKYYQVSVQQGKTDIPGFTRLSFLRANKGQLQEGEGYFIDMDDNALRCDFSFIRVKRELIQQVLNAKIKRLDRTQREQFIKAYHRIKKGN